MKKADDEQASKCWGWNTCAQKIHWSPDLSFKFTVCWMNGYVEMVPLNLTHQKGLCFLLKGFCKAAHSSSHKGSCPHCQAYFYGSSPKQVQNSVGLRWALPLAGHWDTICKWSGNSKHCRLSNSLLIFSLSYHIEKDIEKLSFKKWRTPISKIRSAIHSILSYLNGKLCV